MGFALTQVVKNCATNSLELKKLLYIFLVQSGTLSRVFFALRFKTSQVTHF